MFAYLNLLILGYLPWLVFDLLRVYVDLPLTLLIVVILMVQPLYNAVKQFDYIAVIFALGFLAHCVNLFRPFVLLHFYTNNYMLFAAVIALLSVICKRAFTINYARHK